MTDKGLKQTARECLIQCEHCLRPMAEDGSPIEHFLGKPDLSDAFCFPTFTLANAVARAAGWQVIEPPPLKHIDLTEHLCPTCRTQRSSPPPRPFVVIPDPRGKRRPHQPGRLTPERAKKMFDALDNEYPEVWRFITSRYEDKWNSGRRRDHGYAIGTFIEHGRWYRKLADGSREKHGFKINNTMRSFFARKLYRVYPHTMGFLELRVSRLADPWYPDVMQKWEQYKANKNGGSKNGNH